MERSVFFLVAMAAMLSVSLAYPTGPPLDACESMWPLLHNATASTDPLPFEFSIGSQCYKPGMEIDVVVRVRAGQETYFEGLFVQARKPSASTPMSHGSFRTNGDPVLQTMDCFDLPGSKNALSQKDKAHYECKSFTWMPPANGTEDIRFQMTIVHETDEFWFEVMSTSLAYNANCMAASVAPTCPTTSGVTPLRAASWLTVLTTAFVAMLLLANRL